MESKSRIGSTLIICGTVCIVATLSLAAFFAYLLSQVPVRPTNAPRSPVEDQAGIYIFLMFVCVLAGLAFVVIGVVVEIRQSSQTGSPLSGSPAKPPLH